MENKLPRRIREWSAIVLGPALMAAAMVIFTIPNDIAPGGVSGMATALAAIFPVKIGVISLLLNVPLFLVALRSLGWRPLIKTGVATLLLSLFIDWFGFFLPSYTNNVLLAAVLGGVLLGVGLGVLFLFGVSSGGTDLLTLVLNKRLPNVSAGSLLMGIDICVVIFAVFVFRNIDVALYSSVTLFLASKVIDNILAGVDFAKVIYIVTERGEQVTAELNEHLDRGVTVLPAKGGYTGKEKQVLMTVTRRGVLSETLRLIKRTDPQAFLFVLNATEVHGEGFKPMEVED